MDTKLKSTTKMLYGFGQIAVNAKDALFHYYFLFFFNSVLGLSGTIVGYAKLIALMFDAITDPLMGGISDNFRSNKYGRRHLFILLGAFPLGAGLWLLFSPPENLSQVQLIAWMIGFAVVTRLSLTVFFIPYISLTADLSEDYRERTLLSTSRIFFGNFAGVVLGLIFVLVFSANIAVFPDGTLNRAGFSKMGLLSGIVAIIAILSTFWGTRKHIPGLIKKSEHSKNVPWWRAYHEIAGAFAIKSFRTLSLSFILLAIMAGVATAVTIYMGSFYWGFDTNQFALYALTVGIAVIPGAIIAPVMTRIFDKKIATIISTLMFAILYTLPIVGRTLGIIPENGAEGHFELILIFAFFAQIFSICIMIITEAMMADVASEYELKTGRQQEGILFSAIMFARKSSFGIGGLIAGVGLDMIAFPKQTRGEEIGADVMLSLGVFVGCSVFMLCLLAIVLILGYPITRETHSTTLEKLDRRRHQGAV